MYGTEHNLSVVLVGPQIGWIGIVLCADDDHLGQLNVRRVQVCAILCLSSMQQAEYRADIDR